MATKKAGAKDLPGKPRKVPFFFSFLGKLWLGFRGFQLMENLTATGFPGTLKFPRIWDWWMVDGGWWLGGSHLYLRLFLPQDSWIFSGKR